MYSFPCQRQGEGSTAKGTGGSQDPAPRVDLALLLGTHMRTEGLRAYRVQEFRGLVYRLCGLLGCATPWPQGSTRLSLKARAPFEMLYGRRKTGDDHVYGAAQSAESYSRVAPCVPESSVVIMITTITISQEHHHCKIKGIWIGRSNSCARLWVLSG